MIFLIRSSFSITLSTARRASSFSKAGWFWGLKRFFIPSGIELFSFEGAVRKETILSSILSLEL